MTDRFHNPYHFVPADAGPEGFGAEAGELSAEEYRSEREIGAPLGARSHDRYCEGTFSGRIVCKLTAKTPLIVGGERKARTDKDGKPIDYTLIEPFRIGKALALPGTSLKGMLSTIVEAASFSALRVLHDEYPISYRQDTGHSVSAMGVLEKNERGDLVLRPLALPNMQLERGALAFVGKKRDLWSKVFCKFATLKGKLENPPERPDKKSQCCGAKMWPGAPLASIMGGPVPGGIRLAQKGKYIYGQFPNESLEECCGWLHDFDAPPGEIPAVRKFDTFVPDPSGVVHNPPLRIPQQVIDNFHALADSAGEHAAGGLKLPFAPKTVRKQDEKRIRLRAGMTVYFDVEKDPETHEPVVSQIQLSSVWRNAVEVKDESFQLARMWNFFPKDRVPLHSARAGRITPAEWLFGFVQANKGSDNSQRMAYAGRVRVANAVIDAACTGPEMQAVPDWNRIAAAPDVPADTRARAARLEGYIRLKELSSPEPPSPQLYFRNRSGPDEPIAKHDLSAEKHKPQGIKLYLHHDMAGDDTGKAILEAARTKLDLGANGEGESAKRKVAVKPLKPGTAFWFHVDFDNLTRFELELLCFALKPGSSFHHKLGMAKPLGFGTVEIEPVAFFEVDRKARYTTEDVFAAPRYAGGHGDAGLIAQLPEDRYKDEKSAVCAAGEFAPAQLAAAYAKRLEDEGGPQGQDVLNALRALGAFPRVPDECGLHPPVHTPLAMGQRRGAESGENETFRWFVNNQKQIEKARRDKPADPQQLKPIVDGARLPSLKKNTP